MHVLLPLSIDYIYYIRDEGYSHKFLIRVSTCDFFNAAAVLPVVED